MPYYRRDVAEPQPNGSTAHYARWIGGPTLAAVTKCPIAGLPDAYRYSVRVTGEPDSWFSIPSVTTIKRRTVRGYLTTRENATGEREYEFRPMRSSRGALWAALIPRVERMAILRAVAADWHSGQASRGYRLLSRTSRWMHRRRISGTIGNVQRHDGTPIGLAEYLCDRSPLHAAFREYVIATFTVRDGAYRNRYVRRAAL